MKKFISLVLVAVIVFSFAACNNDPAKTNEPSTLELDIEELKASWTDGILFFADDKQATVPSTVSQFVESSGLKLSNVEIISNMTLEPQKSKDIYITGEGVYLTVKCKNLTDETVKVTDATIVGYSFNNTNTGNKIIKFANTLTVGVGKADVEEALGKPERTAGEDSLYFYNGKNAKGKKVELRIGFNSDNIVNSVAFEIDT